MNPYLPGGFFAMRTRVDLNTGSNFIKVADTIVDRGIV